MSQLYIANGTHQNHQFHYRIPERPRPRVIDIPAFCQVSIQVDDDSVLDTIVKQLERFGAVPKTSIRLITRPRTLVYSLEKKAIDSNKLNEALERDEAARQDVAAQKTQDAGLALLPTASKNGNPNAIKSTSLEVKQVTETASGLGDTKGGVNVEINVRKDAPGKMQTEKRVG